MTTTDADALYERMVHLERELAAVRALWLRLPLEVRMAQIEGHYGVVFEK